MRFPKKEKRVELRSIFDANGQFLDEILHNDDYFEPFSLRLPEKLPDHKNKFKGLKPQRWVTIRPRLICVRFVTS